MTALSVRTLHELTIDDEAALSSVPLYAELKAVLVDAGYQFRILPVSKIARWDRALLLNLTFWGGEGGDVLPDEHIAADVVAHVAWHHLASRALVAKGAAPSADALFAGEAIASAFDLYVLGCLLSAPRRSGPSYFLDTQVPAMAESASAAGLSGRAFKKMLGDVAADPRQSFEDLRSLLVDVSTGLLQCVDAGSALAVLDGCASHRFSSLLHRYELSNWVLWTRAWAADRLASDPVVRALDTELRRAASSVDWLAAHWLKPTVR